MANSGKNRKCPDLALPSFIPIIINNFSLQFLKFSDLSQPFLNQLHFQPSRDLFLSRQKYLFFFAQGEEFKQNKDPKPVIRSVLKFEFLENFMLFKKKVILSFEKSLENDLNSMAWSGLLFQIFLENRKRFNITKTTMLILIRSASKTFN